MNRSNMEYIDHTWNPITGCLHNCKYCFARKMSNRFSGNVKWNRMRNECYEKEGDLYVLNDKFTDESGRLLSYPFGFWPTLHKYRFDYLEKLKMGNNILIGSMADLFGEWVPDAWLQRIFNKCKEHGRHNYLFLTKNWDRYRLLYEKGFLPEGENFWFGLSVTGKEDLSVGHAFARNRFLCMEPLLDEITINGSERIADWIVMGAETGNRVGKVIPKLEWVERILAYADSLEIPVFMKSSLLPIMGEEGLRREYPKGLTRKKVSEKLIKRMEGQCVTCGGRLPKKNMIALYVKRAREGGVKLIAHVCESCFEGWCKQNGIG